MSVAGGISVAGASILFILDDGAQLPFAFKLNITPAGQATYDASTGIITIDVGGGSAVTFVDAEVPTGAIPGTAYTLAAAPSPADSLQLFRNGLLQTEGIDYTLVGDDITYNVAMEAGDAHVCWYRT